ncbi:MAG: hypothetical protein ACRDFB_09490, partial [Rhabdochlamydiaceae bacterium]
LLVKMYKGTKYYNKLVHAAKSMTMGNNNQNNKLYGWIRRKVSKVMSGCNNLAKRQEVRQKLRELRLRDRLYPTKEMRELAKVACQKLEFRKKISERNKRLGIRPPKRSPEEYLEQKKRMLNDNPMSGKMWATNGIKNMVIKKTDPISNGYRRGLVRGIAKF